MAAGSLTYVSVKVTGIAGSTPICKRISFDIGATGTEEQFYDVSDNNPNGTYPSVGVDDNGTHSLKVRLYDAQGAIIAESGYILVTG